MMEVRVFKRLPHFDLQVEAEFGEGITVLAGASGSGKSTLLKMIAGFDAPDEGRIAVAGRELFHGEKGVNLFPEKRRIGYVPQNYLLFPHLTVSDNIAFGPRALRWPRQTINAKVDAALDLCGIRHHAGRYPSELSGGEQQRVALARAIVTEPAVLLLDEPFSALDVQTRRIIRTDVRDILRASGIPALMVTHDPTDALAFGTRICIMERGHIVQQGRFQDLRDRPRTRFVAEFAGLNAYHGLAHTEGDGMVSIRLEEGVLLTAVGEWHGRVLVMIDPTDVTLHRDPPVNSARNCFPAQVRDLHEESSGLWKLSLRGAFDVIALISSDALRQMRIEQGDSLYASVKATALKVEGI